MGEILASRTGTVRFNRKGDPGADGEGVTVSTIQYQSGYTQTTPPTGKWSDSPVTVPNGYFLWTKITYTDGSTSYSVARQGTDGKTGPGYYMAGSYADDITFERNEYMAPVVELDGAYYALLKSVGTNVNPKTDVANGGGTWGKFDILKYIFSEVAFIKFGKLGSAIFNEDFMYSQFGVDSNGNDTAEYTKFDASLSDPTTNTAFMPNILLNLFNGKAWFNDAKINGTVALNALYRKAAEGGTSEQMTDLSGYSGFAMSGVYSAPQLSGKYFTELVGLNLSNTSKSVQKGEIHFLMDAQADMMICNGVEYTAVSSITWEHSGGFIRMTMLGFRYADYGTCWVVETQADENFSLTVNSAD